MYSMELNTYTVLDTLPFTISIELETPQQLLRGNEDISTINMVSFNAKPYPTVLQPTVSISIHDKIPWQLFYFNSLPFGGTIGRSS